MWFEISPPRETAEYYRKVKGGGKRKGRIGIDSGK